MKFASIPFLLMSLLILSVTDSVEAQIIIDFDEGISTTALGSRGSGQTFTPADAMGAGDASILELTGFTLWGGANGELNPSTTTYVVIYDGDPDGGATQVGASSNFLDSTVNFYDLQFDWNFENLTLDADTTYWAMFSNAPVDTNTSQSSGGTVVEFSVQTLDSGTDYAGGISLIADRTPHGTGFLDLRFVAEFAVPDKILLGDVNCDGVVDLLDVAPFVDLIVNGGFLDKADINQDGAVDLLDVGPFVALLTGG